MSEVEITNTPMPDELFVDLSDSTTPGESEPTIPEDIDYTPIMEKYKVFEKTYELMHNYTIRIYKGNNAIPYSLFSDSISGSIDLYAHNGITVVIEPSYLCHKDITGDILKAMRKPLDDVPVAIGQVLSVNCRQYASKIKNCVSVPGDSSNEHFTYSIVKNTFITEHNYRLHSNELCGMIKAGNNYIIVRPNYGKLNTTQWNKLLRLLNESETTITVEYVGSLLTTLV